MIDESLQVASRLMTDVGSFIIVQVGGTMICGQPVSVAKWYEFAAANMGTSESMTSEVIGLLQMFDKKPSTDERVWDRTHLHLAKAYTIGGGVRADLGLWRCAFADVQGWTLGRLQ